MAAATQASTTGLPQCRKGPTVLIRIRADLQCGWAGGGGGGGRREGDQAALAASPPPHTEPHLLGHGQQ